MSEVDEAVRFDNYVIPAKVRACLAQMAELVDALGSGPSGGNTVEVRVLFWAPHLSPDRSRLPQVLHKSLPL